MQKSVLSENVRPNDKQLVKFKRCGDISEIMWSEKRNNKSPITKLSDDLYLLNATGEIKEFEHKATSRADNLKIVAHSLSNLRDLINCNVTEPEKVRWCTLTYAENMTDSKRLYKDFEKFIKRFRYRYGQIEYIIACEPQGRGAWHIHALLIFPGVAPFIPNSEFAEIWGHGFVSIKKLADCDNLGAYLTAYLGDMELSEAFKSDVFKGSNYLTPDMFSVGGVVKECEVLQDDGTTLKKKFIKGARLRFYPDHFNIYRFSSGIKKPEIELISNNQAEKKVSADTLTFEKTVTLSDDDGFSNLLNYRYYNAKR